MQLKERNFLGACSLLDDVETRRREIAGCACVSCARRGKPDKRHGCGLFRGSAAEGAL